MSKLSSANTESFEYSVNKFVMKFLKTINTDITKCCQAQFGF